MAFSIAVMVPFAAAAALAVPCACSSARISPDGLHIAVAIGDEGMDIRLSVKLCAQGVG